MATITQADLKEYLHYDPETGQWTWLKVLRGRMKAGDRAGRLLNGYNSIGLFGQTHQASHLAWLYMTGEWPSELIDHINHKSADDRWINLREANYSENNFNRAGNDGSRGVRQQVNRWRVCVGKFGYVGYFDSFEEACAARDAEAIRQGGEFPILNQDVLNG